MSERAISDPVAGGWKIDPVTGYWMWAAGSGGGAVDAYTKAESDDLFVPKSGDTTINGTLTATNMVATG